ncbi:MAG: 5-oxoprolinase subunit PxpB [Bacteroidota bacterium]
MLTPSPYRIYPCGDHAITLELGEVIDIAINQKVMAVYHRLLSQKITGVIDIIPAYSSLTLVYDVLTLAKKQAGGSVYERMKQLLEKEAASVNDTTNTLSPLVRIPVCYDASLAPDLASLAETHQLSIEDVIALHTGKTYRVYMIGFLPGFAYMGSVDEKINTPRKPQPRTKVPAGSVGIAGEQTGIYPLDSPGGWQLIGQTPVKLFDTANSNPCFLNPGDEVEFYAISLTEFIKAKQS